jgi:hypothetical protein
MIDDADAVKLADFGLAVASASRVRRWMAPKCLHGAAGTLGELRNRKGWLTGPQLHAGHASFQVRVETVVFLLVLTGN